MRVHEILLVEDNPADATLVREALASSSQRSQLICSGDAESAVKYLRQRLQSSGRPDLIILDLNLPKKDGRALLAEVKTDPSLHSIPVVVFSTSQSDRDIARSYELGANCYVSKPVELKRFFSAVREIVEFWYGCASLPEGELGEKENHARTSDPCTAD